MEKDISQIDVAGRGVQELVPDFQRTQRSHVGLLLLLVGLIFAAFAIWAAASGNLQAWMLSLASVPYGLAFTVIVAVLLFVSILPFGWGYSRAIH